LKENESTGSLALDSRVPTDVEAWIILDGDTQTEPLVSFRVQQIIWRMIVLEDVTEPGAFDELRNALRLELARFAVWVELDREKEEDATWLVDEVFPESR
jgi:hypothetical protein